MSAHMRNYSNPTIGSGYVFCCGCGGLVNQGLEYFLSTLCVPDNTLFIYFLCVGLACVRGAAMVTAGGNGGGGQANSGGVAPSPRIFTRYQSDPVLYFPDEPTLAGGRRGSYVFERRTVPPSQLLPHVFSDHMFLLVLGNTAVPYRSRLNGHLVKGNFEPGHFRFVAAGDSLATSWSQPIDSILIAIQPDTLQRALGDDATDPAFELISKAELHADPVLTHLTLALQSYLECGGLQGKLFEQSIVTAISLHLLHAYGNGKRTGSPAARGRSLQRWKRKRVEEYVHDNLGRADLHLGEIAAAAGLSPCELSRTYRATAGRGLWQFVLECRAQAALSMLCRQRNMPLALIAPACGFESYSQFVAAFRKFHGQLPSEFRKRQGIIR
ncbi:MAG: helix-turn-helix transcriptional regulator [Gammaproteobacteria bacterium]|nr:helix-turn-helix transcriptional regulator [Gammaproteobacteria bacterium]